MRIRKFGKGLLFCTLFLCLSICCRPTQAWEWSDLLGDSAQSEANEVTPLTIGEVSSMRVRDLKRRLQRSHGYGADEVARMLDKKELIHALAFEEEKLRMRQEEVVKRRLVKRGILTAIITIVVVMCWPLLQHGLEVGHVNFVVYTDKKKHEISRCMELKSYAASFGVGLMFIVDILQFWLTASIMLSWVMRSKYFFPVPSLPVRPGQMMGGKVAQSSLGGYGLNVGPMAVGWAMRFVYRHIENWTGKAMARAHKAQRRAAREWESEEDKAARKAARKLAKKEAKARKEAQKEAMQTPSNAMPPPDWAKPANIAPSATGVDGDFEPAASSAKPTADVPHQKNPFPASSEAHQEFLDQVEQLNADLGDLD